MIPHSIRRSCKAPRIQYKLFQNLQPKKTASSSQHMHSQCSAAATRRKTPALKQRLLFTNNQYKQNYSHKATNSLPRKAQPESHHVSQDESRTRPTTAPLAMLPLRMILRSLGTSTISASPLLPLSLKIMDILAHSKSRLLDADVNPVLKYVLNKTIFAQFCAGENAEQVSESIAQLKHIGFTGVILAYAKESPEVEELPMSPRGEETQAIIDKEIRPWAQNMYETIRLVRPGDIVALKFTGAGELARYLLTNDLEPTPTLKKSIQEICQFAQDRRVRILFDGEEDALQGGIDTWTMDLAREFNNHAGSATVFGTYQAYKKSTTDVLGHHLAQAQAGGFTLGVKLVRGAYLESDPRELFHATKAETDTCYDEMAKGLLKRQWSGQVKGADSFPDVSLILATHNARSVRLAYKISDAGEAKSEMMFAQLQGMADEISCELVQANCEAASSGKTLEEMPALPVYKYMAWGTTGQCIKYLLRRAEENKEALGRARHDRDAMWHEVVRRIKAGFRTV